MRAMATSSSRISSSFQKNVFSQLPALETSKQTSALGHVFQAVHTMQLEQPNAGAQPRPEAEARHERTLEGVGCSALLASAQRSAHPDQAFGRASSPKSC